MKKSVFAAMFLGASILILGAGAGCATSTEPTTDEPAATEPAPATHVEASGLELAPPETNACVKNSCLGARTCSSCCAGHACVSRNGCPQLGLACD